MNRWINYHIEKAGWIRFTVSFALLFAYSFWSFATPNFWSRASEAAAPLPETLFGFIDGQPASAIARLGEATSDYIWYQLFDLPFALLNLLMLTAAIALGLRALNLGAGALRYVLVLPLIMFAAELMENTLLAFMTGDYISDKGVLVTVQQSATSIKGIAGMGGTVLGALSLIAATGVSLAKLFKKKSA